MAENNDETTRRPGGVTGKGFAPGTSGNPGGRPKIPAEVVEAFRGRTLAAVATLDKVMADFATNATTDKGDPLVPAAAAVRAAEVVLDRGWGSAPKVVELTADVRNEVEVKERPPADPRKMVRVLQVLQRSGALERLLAQAQQEQDAETPAEVVDGEVSR